MRAIVLICLAVAVTGNPGSYYAPTVHTTPTAPQEHPPEAHYEHPTEASLPFRHIFRAPSPPVRISFRDNEPEHVTAYYGYEYAAAPAHQQVSYAHKSRMSPPSAPPQQAYQQSQKGAPREMSPSAIRGSAAFEKAPGASHQASLSAIRQSASSVEAPGAGIVRTAISTQQTGSASASGSVLTVTPQRGGAPKIVAAEQSSVSRQRAEPNRRMSLDVPTTFNIDTPTMTLGSTFETAPDSRVEFMAPPFVPTVPQRPRFRILRFNEEIHEGQRHSYSFDTSNGIHQEDETRVEHFPGGPGRPDRAILKKTGSYSYVSPEGQLITTSYIADENGFRVVGDHIPTPPPTPREIMRSLQQLRAQGRMF